jgi:hypothetical protein
MATKKTTGKSIANYDEKLAELARRTKALEDTAAIGGNKISVRGGAMTFNGAAVPGNKLNCIVLDHCLENHFYEGDFDPDSPTSPVCFALSKESARTMAPHDASTKKQNDQCEGCPKNAFGSAERGRGKACKNVRRLVLIPEDSLKTGVDKAEVATFIVPVTSCKNWQGYVDQLATTLKRPPLAVVTEISCAPHPKNQVEVSFSMKKSIDDGASIDALIQRNESVQAVLMRPYEQIEQSAAPAKGKGKSSGKKPGAKARR